MTASIPPFEECDACTGEGEIGCGAPCRECRGNGIVPAPARPGVVAPEPAWSPPVDPLYAAA